MQHNRQEVRMNIFKVYMITKGKVDHAFIQAHTYLEAFDKAKRLFPKSVIQMGYEYV